MYKFEINANSPEELKVMQVKFAKEWLNFNEAQLHLIPSPPVDLMIKSMERIQVPKQDFVNIVNSDLSVTLVPPVVTTSDSVEVDSRGIKWDARVHSASKSTNKDGSWRTRRNLEDAYVNQIEKELRTGAVSQAVPQSTVETAAPVQFIPPAPAPTVAVEMPTFAQQPKEPLTNTIPTAAVPSQPVQKYDDVPVPAGIKPVHSYATFKANLPMVMTHLINTGAISQQYIDEMKKYFNVKEIWNVLASEAQCLEIFNTFVKHGLITEVNQ